MNHQTRKRPTGMGRDAFERAGNGKYMDAVAQLYGMSIPTAYRTRYQPPRNSSGCPRFTSKHAGTGLEVAA